MDPRTRSTYPPKSIGACNHAHREVADFGVHRIAASMIACFIVLYFIRFLHDAFANPPFDYSAYDGRIVAHTVAFGLWFSLISWITASQSGPVTRRIVMFSAGVFFGCVYMPSGAGVYDRLLALALGPPTVTISLLLRKWMNCPN